MTYLRVETYFTEKRKTARALQKTLIKYTPKRGGDTPCTQSQACCSLQRYISVKNKSRPKAYERDVERSRAEFERVVKRFGLEVHLRHVEQRIALVGAHRERLAVARDRLLEPLGLEEPVPPQSLRCRLFFFVFFGRRIPRF